MGMLQDFTCPACGLNGHVSGGEDAGMLAMTTTIYCKNCDTLQDAIVEKCHVAVPARRIKPRCEKSRHHPVKLWNQNELCPRCGQSPLALDERGIVTMWD